MAYEHTNSKGVRYYLHNKGRLNYFSKNPDGAVDMPAGNWEVIENQKTGLPMLKKKV